MGRRSPRDECTHRDRLHAQAFRGKGGRHTDRGKWSSNRTGTHFQRSFWVTLFAFLCGDVVESDDRKQLCVCLAGSLNDGDVLCCVEVEQSIIFMLYFLTGESIVPDDDDDEGDRNDCPSLPP